MGEQDKFVKDARIYWDISFKRGVKESEDLHGGGKLSERVVSKITPKFLTMSVYGMLKTRSNRRRMSNR